ncbi:MAG: ribosome-associated translation inhibitor RaiA [Phycisphaerae bacterium]|nr:ribosome-associated translation inhibitor RaiA [Phycisphaerae bacterium]
MQISVISRHVEVTDKVKDYAHEKVSKLPRFFDRVQSIDVIMDHDSGNFSVEILVRADRTDPFIARESGPDTFALIDVLTDKLGRQLRRHKERFRNRKHVADKIDHTEFLESESD